MKSRETPLVSKIILLYLCLFLGSIHHSKAQAEPIDSIRYFLDASKPYDSLKFTKGIGLLQTFPDTDKNLPQLVSLAEGYARTTNLDTAFMLKYYILIGLSKIDNDEAIEYGRALYEELSKYKAPNAKIIKGLVLIALRMPYRNGSRIEEGFSFFNEELKYFLSVKDSANISHCYYLISGLYSFSGLTSQAIYTMKKSVSWLKKTNQSDFIAGIRTGNSSQHYANRIGILGHLSVACGEFEISLEYSRLALELSKSFTQLSKGYNKKNILNAFILSGQMDSATHFIPSISEKDFDGRKDALASYFQILSLYHLKKQEYSKSDSMVSLCYQLVDQYKIPALSPGGDIDPDYYSALIRIEQGNFKEAIRLLELDLPRVRNIRLNLIRDYEMLGTLYPKIGDYKNASIAYANYISLQKSLEADQNKYATLSFETEQQIAANELALTNSKNEAELATTTRNYSIGMAILLVLLGLGLLARYRSQKKTNHALGVAMAELKASQAQLVQSEKMASLGELTAGIAHEIQNPLNFVNNFAETSKELLNEMKTALVSGDQAEATAIADDVILNLEKIHSHGNRADSIVKGMLQHSRSNSGVKELTNINALADEYLRLAYHGLRAKNPSFNALTKTEFDQSIGNINVIPQDIGRVLLNMINNAFYAVDEKKKEMGDGYHPEVTLSTRLVGFNNPSIRESANPSIGLSANSLIISVKDNGNGIPPEVQKKIFQPFFTTKPTGQGTGLGLSLSYDIIKAHGGEIKVNSKPGEGTEFRIILPSKSDI